VFSERPLDRPPLPIVDFQFQTSQAFGVVVGAREFRLEIARAAACSRLPIFCFLGPSSGRPRGLRSAVRAHAGAESGFPLRATDGECPVQRLKAWLKEVDPSWHAPDARLDPVYPRLGGQDREPSAHGPSEVPSAIARGQVDEQIGQDDVGPEPPRQPGLHICDAWRRHAVAR
jgi:hypothetical protein